MWGKKAIYSKGQHRDRKKKKITPSAPLVDVRSTPPLCVPAIREKVTQWRNAGYPGITDTTRQLLNYWFHTDHRLPNGRRFAYHYSQQYALETLIYLFEVTQARRQKQLIESFATRQDIRLLQNDDFSR